MEPRIERTEDTKALLAARRAALAAALSDSEFLVTTAESCTCGQLAAVFAGDAALGPHLDRGFIVYSADSKCDILGLSRSDVERNEAVNREVARALASGALERSGADISIGITGFCGPRQADEEVGLVYLACIGRASDSLERECRFGDRGRKQVLDHAVATALELVVEMAERLKISAAAAGKTLADTTDRART